MPEQPKAPVRPQRRTAWGLIETALSAGAGALLLALTFITCIDVVARYWFNAPLSGAYELTELFLAALVFLALPITTGRGEHVEVDLIDAVAGGAISRMARPVTGLLTAGVLALFAWRLWEHALRLASDGAISDSLALPIAPVAFLAAIGCGLASLLAISRALRPAAA